MKRDYVTVWESSLQLLPEPLAHPATADTLSCEGQHAEARVVLASGADRGDRVSGFVGERTVEEVVFPLPEDAANDTPEAGAKKDRAGLIGFLKNHLEEQIGDVRLSSRLTDSPVCLVAPENDVDLNIGRVLKMHQKYETKQKPVLEINGTHPLIAKLDDMLVAGGQEAELADAAELLLDQALIVQGEPVRDPASFARRMAAFLQRGLAA